MANDQSKVPWKSTLFMSKWLTLWKKLLSVKMAQWESAQAGGKWCEPLRSTCKLACMGSGWSLHGHWWDESFSVAPAGKFPQPPKKEIHCLTSPGNVSHPQHCAEWMALFKGHLERDAFKKNEFPFSQEEVIHLQVCRARVEGETKSNC